MTTTLNDLARDVAAVVSRMPAGHVQALSGAVVAAPCCSPGLPGKVLAALPNPAYREHAEQLLACWQRVPALSGESLALVLLSALAIREAERASESVEAVATGPSTPHVSLRHTRAVILDLIKHAEREILIVCFAAYKVPDLAVAIREAVARGVTVRMILETSEDSAGTLSHDAAHAFESAGEGLEFYVWPADRRPFGASAKLHAKAVVADGSAAFVTSANLTGAALDHNLELGVLVRGGAVPKRLAEHFQSLMAAGTLRRV
jgi:phosphatidylserine/phosphatidylglycerophosphate/cardiolipin synthase-like enzyme